MRIHKKLVVATTKPVVANEESKELKYQDAIDYIKSAISYLGVNGRNNKVAKEAIANLSVILLDLQASEDGSLEQQILNELSAAEIDVNDKDKVMHELIYNSGYTAKEAQELYDRILEVK